MDSPEYEKSRSQGDKRIVSRAAASDASRSSRAALAFGTVYVVLLLAIPSGLSFKLIGSAGRPATLWGILAFVWWCATSLAGVGFRPQKASPVVVAVLTFVAACLVSYTWGVSAALPASLQVTAGSGLLVVASWSGIALVVAESLKRTDDITKLISRMAFAVMIVASLGILQFVTKSTLLSWLIIPGTSAGDLPVGLSDRAGFTRAVGTAFHPLEYAVVLSVGFPLTLALASKAIAKARIFWFAGAALIAAAATVSVSRSTIIGIAVGGLTVVVYLDKRMRALVISLALFLVAGAAVVPGLLRTTFNLFLGIGVDASTQSRTDALTIAGRYFYQSPIIGRGYNTFLPQTWIFDNAYVLILLELGIVGFLCLAALLVTGVLAAGTRPARDQDTNWATAGPAVRSALLATATLFAFFDGVSFPQAAGMLFVCLGLAAAIGSTNTTDRVQGLDP